MSNPPRRHGPDQVPDGWNATATGYNRDVWDLMTPFVGDVIEHAQLAAEHELLDVAAGTGRITIEAAPHVKRVLAVDFADDMLTHLKARATEGGHANVEAEQMDGQALDLPDASFDRVVSNFGVIFFPDQPKGLAEMRRVLRYGGRAVVTSWKGPAEFEAFRFFGTAVGTALPELQMPENPPIFSLNDAAHFESLMREAGFATVDVHTVTHAFELPTPDALWDLMSNSAPPAVALLKRLSAADVEKVRVTLLDAIRSEKGDGACSYSATAHIGVGTV